MAMQEFSPYRTYQNVIQRWWLIVLSVLLGGIVGLVLHGLCPTIYEAQTFLTASMNFPPNEYYTQYEEDYAFTVAATHIDPLGISPSLVPALQTQGHAITVEEFLRNASLERMQAAWALRYRSSDPGLAVAVVELWAVEAYDKLAALRDHSLRAQSYYSQLRFLNTCYRYALISLQALITYPPDYQLVCTFPSAERIYSEQIVTSRLFAEQLRLSRGMNPYFVIDIPNTAGTQVYQTAYDRNLMTLAGALVGFVASFWLVNFGPGKGRRG
jgi:hypothetical protein